MRDILAPYYQRVSLKYANLYPKFMTIDFQEAYFIKETSSELRERIKQVAQFVKTSEAAQIYAWILHDGIFLADPPLPNQEIPLAEKLLGDNAGVFQYMIATSPLPLIQKNYIKHGFQEEFIPKILLWISGTSQIYTSGHHGLPGHNLQQTRWIKNYLNCELFSIGRLEYLRGTAQEWLPAIYLHKKTKRPIAFCQDGWILHNQKIIMNEKDQKENYFHSTLKVSGDSVTGYPITPNGQYHPNIKKTISLQEYMPLLQPDDIVPSIHIPGGGKMTPDAIKSSLLEAKEFFAKHFNNPIKLFTCCSWILNPYWQRFLPNSNLSDFQRNLYSCIPIFTKGTDGLFFIFGHDNGNINDFPADNSVRRAFHQLAAEKEKPFSGNGFILTADIEKYGTQYYREKANIQE